MTSGKPARATTHGDPRILVAGLLVVIAAIAGGCGYRHPASLSAAVPLPIASSTATPSMEVHRSEPRAAVGEADGAVPDGTTVFDDEIPGVGNLDPALLGALRDAAKAAADDRVEIVVNSGWRSPAYQERLLVAAVAKYGSRKQAARWVGTPKTSAHVSGDAVDIGPVAAAEWLARHGATYGLCQIYRNEPWHYELRSNAIDRGCPPMYADAAHDPRMQQ